MGKRELIALLNLSSWCLVMVEQLFLAVPRGCLQFVIVVFPDHTHLLVLGHNYTLVDSKLITISFIINKKKCPNTLNPPGSDYRATLQQTFGLQSNAIPSEILCFSVRTYTPEFRFIHAK